MSSSRFLRWVLFTLAIACFVVGSAGAAIKPESDVLLPWFEVDLENEQLGLVTSFSLVNASPDAVQTMITVYSNWGIPLLEVPVTFARTEAKTIDLREWIIDGVLPGRTLTPLELAHLQAALTGKPSPIDQHYYGSSFSDGLAVGYVIAKTLGNRPDALWGDTYSVDIGANYFEAETLTALTHDLAGDCKRHGVRFVNEDRLYEGSELIIWSGRRLTPSPTPVPSGKVKVVIAVYDQSGRHVQDCHRELVSVEPIQVCHLDITPPIGWLDIRTEDPSVVLEHLHSTSRASAELHSYCLNESLKLSGPGITIEKTVNGKDADRPGYTVNVGEEVIFEYRVTNDGTMSLTPVTVVDDAGLTVSCPKSSLDPGETMVCTAKAVAEGCTHVNVGTATGTTPDGTVVTASDEAYYEGLYSPSLTMELLINDNEADMAPGPLVETGDPVYWTFVITNDGDAVVEDIVVSRKDGEPATCARTRLEPGESMTCTAESLAKQGQHHEVATVSGTEPCGRTVVANDAAYYFGRPNAPGIELRKYVGADDANTPPGPTVPAGTTIEWQFVVTNTGNLPLQNIVLTDDRVSPVCPSTTLEVGASMTCTASSPALACQQSNTATVTGYAAERDKTVSAQDVAHYTGLPHPGLALELKLNGDPADEPPGAWLDDGTPIQLTYDVSNTGDVQLSNLVVSDDHDRSATCPKTTLLPGESMVCTASTIAVPGTHEIVGSAHGQPACGESVQADDPVYYRGRALSASVSIVKMTNGIHAEAPPGPSIPLGSPVLWTYVITNTGTVQLTEVAVTDNREVAVTCPKTVLASGESMTCTASGVAQACQYQNSATVVAKGDEANVTALDESYYFGQHDAAVTIDKKTNGEDAPQAPGITITAGSAVQWTMIVTNTGNVPLTQIAVTDDRAGVVTCPKTSLQPGESMTCTASGNALSGQQRNVASVTAAAPCGPAVSASDASHYVGVSPGIRLEKLINGQDADDSAHAVQLLDGAPVLWSFVVTNTGDVALGALTVTDAAVSPVTCPKTTLQPGESMTCTASGTAQKGLDCNTATASGTSPQSATVTSTDTACYYGNSAAIQLVKKTNGSVAATPPGPQIPIGNTVTWTYQVTNTGEVQLTAVTVTDDRGVTVTCPKSALDPGESMTCTGSGTATSGQYSNTGTASGTPAGGSAVTDSDVSHYLGVGTQGCTPGYWKNHTDSWPPTGYGTTAHLSTVFAQTASYPFASSTMLEALGFAGGTGVNGAGEILLRAGVAALLNASHPTVNYPRDTSSVLADVNAALATENRDTLLSLAAALDADNNLGCPLN